MSDGRTWGTIVGGVVGFFTAGVGFAAGAAIGGAIGGLLEPRQRTETNRIDDIKVSLSKYGDGIPETWGNNIPAATWIWSTYIIEIGEEQEAGKGGGAVNTNYRQFIHGLLCLGRTPPPGTPVAIRKVWVNGKLNYDASSGLSVGQALASAENPFANVVLFDGRDGQLPIPIIEAYEGVGNVPAFTGRISLFVFGLECPGGRIPQLQFELCIGATTVYYGVIGHADAGLEPRDIALTPDGALACVLNYNNIPFDSATISVYNLFGETVERSIAGVHYPQAISLSSDGKNGIACNTTESTAAVFSVTEGTLVRNIAFPAQTNGVAIDPVQDGIAYVVCSDNTVQIVDYFLGVIEDSFSAFAGQHSRVVISSDGTKLYIASRSANLIQVVDIESRAVVQTYAAPSPEYLALDPKLPVLYVSQTSSPFVRVIDLDTGVTAATFASDSTVYGIAVHPSGGVIYLCKGEVDDVELRRALPTIVLAEASVPDFIESQVLRTGLPADQIDVSDVSDTFWGLTIKGPSSARDRIASVMNYSALGVVEEDGVLRYFRRAGKTSVATIAYEELGFAEDGSEPGDPFPLVHRNAQELPRSITVSYSDPYFDYQTSTVKAMRYAVDSVLDETQTLDMATDGAHAASIARRMLFERWLAQNTRSMAVSRKYAYLSAGDVVTVLSQTGSYGDFMTSKITDTGARIEIECFPADGDLVIQTVPGPSGFQGQQIQPIAAPLQAVILDIPILRDRDNDPGLYVALDSYGAVPASGELFVGNGDETLAPSGIVSASAPIGYAETALGDWQRNLVDEKNLVTINLRDDVFTNITRDQLLEGSENLWALGAPGRWEIGKSRFGDNLGGGRYTLSSHLRGLFGTERCAALHQANDVFVLLRPAGILRPTMGVGDLGLSKRYRAVALGRSFNSATSQSYANTGEGLEPLSPVNLRRAVASRDLTVDRRSRLAMNNGTGSVPLGESTESYRWRFYTSATYATLIGELVTSTAAITAAQQTAIGVTPTATAYVKVAQISDSVGAGHELQATA